MPEYISREAAKKTACSLCRWEGTENCEECEHPIDDIPAADVRPVARNEKKMGFKKIQTYILESESGTSLKASGWICEGEAGRPSWGGQWASKRQKEREAFQQMALFESKKPPEEMKVRWAKYFGGADMREEN